MKQWDLPWFRRHFNMKTVLITGASRGIGAACAKYFAERGWRVIINYNKSEDAALELVRRINENGGEAYCFKADVGATDECMALVEYALSVGGKLDALINNAAIDELVPFDMMPIDRERRMFDVNLFGAMDSTRFALPYMIHERDGAIVNISSIWGQVGASCEVQYSTTKAAIIGFTKSLAKEVAPSGVRVNCVAPGIIDTEMNASFNKEDIDSFLDGVPMERMGTPDEVAQCVYFLCEASYVTGQVLGVNGGYI